MLGTYPGAEQIPADPSNYREAWRESATLIVIHCTDGHGDPRATAAMFATPKDQRQPAVASSAHFIVGQDGTVVQAVSLKDVAYHAHAVNGISIGIEHCARTPGELGKADPGLPPSDAQFAASARLVAWLLALLGLPATRAVIMGHAEADPTTTHTSCPNGCGWDWERYLALVQEALAVVPA